MPTTDKQALIEKIDAAEHTHFALGILVDVAQDDLDKARAAQKESRDRLQSLRKQLIELKILSEVAEYFASREDADHNGERYVPNTEMRLLQDVQQAEQLIGEMYEALKRARKDAERRLRAIQGNDQLQGCEEFYRGYNAVVRSEFKEANELAKTLDAALAKAEGK